MDPCGGLASTAHDLARWSAFVADPDPAVLSPDTLEEMCQPQALIDVDGWTAGMGLGFFLVRSAAGRTWVGHTGGMPGHITGVFTHRESGTGAHGADELDLGPRPGRLRRRASASTWSTHDPVEEEPWRPGHRRARGARRAAGRVVQRGTPFAFSVRAAGSRPGPGRCRPTGRRRCSSGSGDDVYRTVSGRERGELLRVTRDARRHPVTLHWATYLVTREPLAFGEHHRRLSLRR